MTQTLLAIIAVLLGVVVAMLGYGGRRLISIVDDQGRKLNWLLAHHFQRTGEEPE